MGVLFFITAVLLGLVAKEQGIDFEVKLVAITSTVAATAFGAFLVTLSRMIHWRSLAKDRLLELHKAEQSIFVLCDRD